MQYHPRFSLSQIWRIEPGGLDIVRVNLHRQIPLGIEELEQERERAGRWVTAEQAGGLTFAELP